MQGNTMSTKITNLCMSDAENDFIVLFHFWMLGYFWGSTSIPSIADKTSLSNLVGESLWKNEIRQIT